jgi:DNA-binding transcriptional LysR family regulator
MLLHDPPEMFTDFDVREDPEAGRSVRALQHWTLPVSRLSLYYPSRRNPSAAFEPLIEMEH